MCVSQIAEPSASDEFQKKSTWNTTPQTDAKAHLQWVYTIEGKVQSKAIFWCRVTQPDYARAEQVFTKLGRLALKMTFTRKPLMFNA